MCLHAEANCHFLKVAFIHAGPVKGAYAVHHDCPPCKECSKLIHQAGKSKRFGVSCRIQKDDFGVLKFFEEKPGVSIAHIAET